MSEQFGTPLDLLAAVYPSSSPGHVLASFAPAVERAARAGDSIAEAIWREAGTALGRAAVAALEGLSPRVSWGGNLFRAGELLMAPFREELLRLVPSAQLRAPVGSGLGGALLLARRAAKGEVVANPLHMHVFGQG
jgi:N-acetylglucosamine kinase-like BadF-type ATPase